MKKITSILVVAFLVISGFMVFLTPINAETEPNNSINNVEEIDVPGEWSGELNDTNEQDNYTFVLEPSQIIEIEFTSQAPEGQRLTLYNPNQESVFELDSEGSITSDFYSLANETETDYWFIGVTYQASYHDWHGEYTFNVSIGSQDDAGSGGDVASSWANAYEIGEGEYNGGILDLDEVDLYEIELEPSSIIDIEFTSQATDGQKLTLYNPNHEKVFNLESSEGLIESDYYSLANETETNYWFIEVTYQASHHEWHGEYTFDVSISSQNDAGSGGDVASSWANAYEIGEGEYNGGILDLDEVDLYEIELEPSSIIDIEFTSQATDGQKLTLYNPNHEKVFNLESSEGLIESDYYSLANETETNYWFIEVTYQASHHEWHGEYTFDVSISSQDDAGSGRDVASSFNEAYEIEEGEHNGMIRDLDGVDMYKVWLEPESVIEIEFTSQAADDQVLGLFDYNRDEIFTLSTSIDDVPASDSHTVVDDVEADYWFIGVTYQASHHDWHGNYTFDVSIQSPQPDFESSNLRAEPGEVSVGENIEFKLDVTNVGNSPGDYTVEFFVGGTSLGTTTVEDVAVDETVTASLTHSEDTAGTYTVEAEGLTADFTVKKGEPTYYDAEVHVDGEGTITAKWLDKEEVITGHETFVNIPEGTEVTLTAQADTGWEFIEWQGTDETGEEITITMDEDKTITAKFEKPGEADFECSNLRPESSEVNEGEEIDLMIDVENVGEETGDHTVEFFVNGESVGTDTVSVAGGETKTASVTYTPEDTGTYTITSEGEEVSLEVKEDDVEDEAEGIIQDIITGSILCLAAAIIIPLIIFVVVIYLIIKLVKGGSEKEQQPPQQGHPPQQQQQPLQQEQPPSPPEDQGGSGETPPPPPEDE